jgi:hypothetical protein
MLSPDESMNSDVFWCIFAKILFGKCFTFIYIRFTELRFSHGDDAEDRKQDTPARNLTRVANGFSAWFV